MARSLEQNFPDEAVSERTVHQILHRDLHFKFGKLWRKFKLTELHKQNRVVWERTLFLDESCFALTPNSVRSWYPDNDRVPIFEAEQFPKKLHVLGAISSVGTVGPLVFAPLGQAWTVERIIAALNENILPMADAWFGHGNFHIQLGNILRTQRTPRHSSLRWKALICCSRAQIRRTCILSRTFGA